MKFPFCPRPQDVMTKVRSLLRDIYNVNSLRFTVNRLLFRLWRIELIPPHLSYDKYRVFESRYSLL